MKLIRFKLPKPPVLRFLREMDRTILVAIGVAAVAFVVLLVWFFHGGSSIEVVNEPDMTIRSPITGTTCEHPDRRPIAIMLASDPEARPLSGIAKAELVIEMPVTPNGITRMMAVFQCTEPGEIGSIRSARIDFLGLVQSMDAIYAHWGGERDALDALSQGTLDNIDALAYDGSVFYRKSEIPPPHNGFTTLGDLYEKAEELEYDLTWHGSFWPHRAQRPPRTLSNASGGLTLSYPNGNRVRWTYERGSNQWLRSRDGDPEVDAEDSSTVHAGAVIILETSSEFLREQYISVRLTGSGTGALFQDGMRQAITWSRDDDAAPLALRDASDRPVELAPGPVWISVITPGITAK